MSVSIDDVMECITIEIQFEKQKNIIISYVHRAAASDTEVFTNYMETLFAKIYQKRIVFCGNLDTLNPNKVKGTDNFIDTTHSFVRIQFGVRTLPIDDLCGRVLTGWRT